MGLQITSFQDSLLNSFKVYIGDHSLELRFLRFCAFKKFHLLQSRLTHKLKISCAHVQRLFYAFPSIEKGQRPAAASCSIYQLSHRPIVNSFENKNSTLILDVFVNILI